ncbi:MAG: UbiA family prenyltransferase [Pseudomonadota bacterium]
MVRQLLRFLRVRDWFYFLPLPVLSCAPDASHLLRLVAGVGVAACCLAFAYGWNNLRDAQLDHSRGKNPLAGGVASDGVPYLAVLFSLAAVALAGAALLGPVPSLAAGIQLVGAALYSGGPRIKRIPVVGTLTNLWIFCPLAFLCQGSLPWVPGLWVLTGLFSLVLVQNQLLHEAMDHDEDLADGVRTTAAILGPRFTAVVSGVLGLTAGVVIGWLGMSSDVPLLFAGAAFPVSIFSLAIVLRPAGGAPARRRRTQRAVGMLTCGLIWVFYVIAPAVWG